MELIHFYVDIHKEFNKKKTFRFSPFSKDKTQRRNTATNHEVTTLFEQIQTQDFSNLFKTLERD